MNVILHMPDREYISELLTEQMFYVLCNRVDEYAKENNLSENEKAFVYKRLLEEVRKEEN
ncbi:hypothetical protein [Crassaminicella profunda]|uniref:hypothetical protein n=1 Tax=Crassaminicella profunda TaxID=1286698 RepID=UPI001CA62F21|nr:hypothetical protein [Crassaminicella profunda]QZY56228.1 hypothetical protein K7H06_04370 [Crassaminicella profunda]